MEKLPDDGGRFPVLASWRPSFTSQRFEGPIQAKEWNARKPLLQKPVFLQILILRPFVSPQWASSSAS